MIGCKQRFKVLDLWVGGAKEIHQAVKCRVSLTLAVNHEWRITYVCET